MNPHAARRQHPPRPGPLRALVAAGLVATILTGTAGGAYAAPSHAQTNDNVACTIAPASTVIPITPSVYTQTAVAAAACFSFDHHFTYEAELVVKIESRTPGSTWQTDGEDSCTANLTGAGVVTCTATGGPTLLGIRFSRPIVEIYVNGTLKQRWIGTGVDHT